MLEAGAPRAASKGYACCRALLHRAFPASGTGAQHVGVSLPLPLPARPACRHRRCCGRCRCRRSAQILRSQAWWRGWAGMLPRQPGARAAVGQGWVGDATIRRSPPRHKRAGPGEQSWKVRLVPSAKAEFGGRTLFAATGENGLNTTSKTSVFDGAALEPAACDATENAATPARPGTGAAPARGPFRMAPPSGCPGRPSARSGYCVRTTPPTTLATGN